MQVNDRERSEKMIVTPPLETGLERYRTRIVDASPCGGTGFHMGDPSQLGRDALRDAARERIEQQRLPRNKPARMWGGRGSGQICSLCDQPILDTEPEMELEYDGTEAHSVVRFHLQCQSVWDEARQMRLSPWTLVSSELPPLLHVVEARLTLNETRAIILNVMRINHGDTGPVVWLNATTNSPLPESWRPIEWRPLADKKLATPPELQPNRTSQRA
jgi:hypothetical protein